MKNHTLQQRAQFYNLAFPQWPDSHLHVGSRFITGTWMIGNNYRNPSRYYGSYPPRFLERIMSMFPDSEVALHLFSGSLTHSDIVDSATRVYYLFDINIDSPGPCRIRGDAHQLFQYFNYQRRTPTFDLIIADPPYSAEDAEHYGTPMVNRKTVLEECWKVISPGGFLAWLDQVKPMYRKAEWNLCGTIGVDRSTNHRVRMLYMFERK